MMDDPTTNQLIKDWLGEVPEQFKQGAGLKVDVGLFIYQFVQRDCSGLWTRLTLDTALRAYQLISSGCDSRTARWTGVTAEDCVLLWDLGIRVDDDLAAPK